MLRKPGKPGMGQDEPERQAQQTGTVQPLSDFQRAMAAGEGSGVIVVYVQ